jgi:hypothetical protein
VCSFLSVDDFFTAGLGFDLAGAYLLGVGLLASAGDVARRATTFPGYNSGQVVSMAKSRVDAIAGLASIAVGFICQAAAYTAIVGGARVPVGWKPAVGATGAGVCAALLAVVLWRLLGRRALLRELVEIAHYDESGRYRLRQPSRERLAQYAFALGEAWNTDEDGKPTPQANHLLVMRVFGVEAVAEGYQNEDLPPPEAYS